MPPNILLKKIQWVFRKKLAHRVYPDTPVTFKTANHVHAGVHALELERCLDITQCTHIFDAADKPAIHAEHV